MLPPDLAKELAAVTGLPAEAFGTLYLGMQGTVGYWEINGRDYMFAPAEFHLMRPEGFARKLGLPRPPRATTWAPLIKAIIATATAV